MSVDTESGAPRLGLSALLKAALSTAVGALYTRLEIVSTEIEEERERLEEIVLVAIALAFCLCMGILLLSFLVAAYFWDTPARLYVLGGLGLFYLLGAAGFWVVLKIKIKNKPPLFATTMAELAKDRQALQSELTNNSHR
jgi:uncharacterized membrane protein YqjE